MEDSKATKKIGFVGQGAPSQRIRDMLEFQATMSREKPLKIVAIDPGPHTGMSFWSGGIYSMAMVPSARVEIYYAITSMIVKDKVDRVICEDFIGQAYTTPEKETMEIIGFIKGWCFFQGIPLTMQAPAVRKGYLQFAKKYSPVIECLPDHKRHAIDSVAHALRFMHKELRSWEPTF